MLSRLFCVIDTQNVSPTYLGPIITHITQHLGRIGSGRVYMDIMSPNQTWIDQSVYHGLDPIGVYCHPRKNSVDHYLVSDVYLSIENFDGFFPMILSSKPGIIDLLPRINLKSFAEFPSNSSPFILPKKSIIT